MAYGKHTNFVGFKVQVSGEDYGLGWAVEGEEGDRLRNQVLEFPVVTPPWADECDFCIEPGYAEYMIDAKSVLGEDGGHNVFYCQACALTSSDPSTGSPDRWVAPEEAA